MPVLNNSAKTESIALSANTRCTGGHVVHPAEDPKTIIRKNIAAPNSATMAAKTRGVRSMCRNKNTSEVIPSMNQACAAAVAAKIEE